MNLQAVVSTSVALALCSQVLGAGSYGSAVLDYQAGVGSTGFQNTSAALGVPVGDTGFGAATPFNPPFAPTQILKVGGGGSLTLQLNQPILVVPGASIGVFSNNGIIDEDPDTKFDASFNTIDGGRGLAGSPPGLFSNPGTAVVSVSADGVVWTALSATPITFDDPTNVYSDAVINLNFGTGTTLADPFKPYSKSLTDLSGLWFRDASQANDIVRALDGSAGGTWIDVSSTALAQISFVKFDVPADSRLVIDALTAVPEPASLGLVGLGALALLRRRRHG